MKPLMNTPQDLSFTQKERGREIITFIGHRFSRVSKDPRGKAWLVTGLYIFFAYLENTFGSTAIRNTSRRPVFCPICQDESSP